MAWDQPGGAGGTEEPRDSGGNAGAPGAARPPGAFGPAEEYGPREEISGGPVQGFGPAQGFGPPQWPALGPGATGTFGAPPVPPIPSAPPPGPPDRLRAAAVALLNLTGLGLGFALLRRWFLFAACLVATGALLALSLPADPDGVPGGALTGYVVVLVLAAALGARLGLRRPLAWPPRSAVALPLSVVLLAVPAGGVVLYDGMRDDAIEQMLLDRLDTADHLVRAARSEPFAKAKPRYAKALTTYRDLTRDHAGSKAARRVPDRLRAYYTTVGAAYGQKRYCDAIDPLTYLRTVPGTVGKENVGSLADWPDDRLATSLYECGVGKLRGEEATGSHSDSLSELLTTFPDSPQAAKVEPAVSSTIDRAVKDVKGSDPCAARDRLHGLGAQVTALPGEKAGVDGALREDAARAGRGEEDGTYACGVDQYKDGDFSTALRTLDDFLDTYKHDKNRARARKIAIAAEIAEDKPAAGRHLPSMRSGGGISVTISNDSPDAIEVLYTGPVTGSFTLGACGSCTTYFSESTARDAACADSGKHYPHKTISLPPGTTYLLHKRKGGSSLNSHTDSIDLRYGYRYTECAYVVSGFGATDT
jgi:hypothetical protein